MEAQLIRMAISTLNNVEVRGKDNLSRLLGAMEALETVAQSMEQSREEEKPAEDPGHIGGFDIPCEEVTTDGR